MSFKSCIINTICWANITQINIDFLQYRLFQIYGNREHILHSDLMFQLCVTYARLHIWVRINCRISAIGVLSRRCHNPLTWIWWMPCLYNYLELSLIARFMGPTRSPSGADRTQVGPMLALWTLLSGILWSVNLVSNSTARLLANCKSLTHWGCHVPVDIFKWIFSNENISAWIKI